MSGCSATYPLESTTLDLHSGLGMLGVPQTIDSSLNDYGFKASDQASHTDIGSGDILEMAAVIPYWE